MVVLNNTDIDDWIFWLSYESEEEKERKKVLSEKTVGECSYEEIKSIFKYRKYEHILQLLHDNNNSDDEFVEVRRFISHPIIDVMIDKTPKDVLERVKNSLLELKDTSDFSDKIKTLSSKQNISIEDRFIRYAISGDRTHYLMSLREINNSLPQQKRVSFHN